MKVEKERTRCLQKGQITKALSGFYYITDETGMVYQTRARGVFRKRKLTPLVGDLVHFESENRDEGTLTEILPRENELKRPPVANVDVGMIITSAVDPEFSLQLLDRFLIMLESKHIQPVIFLTKMDLADAKRVQTILEYKEAYEKIGYSFIVPTSGESLSKKALEVKLEHFFEHNVVVFMGQSGAGKSTLLNTLNPKLQLKTAETSRSLGRGKHTTRHVELLPVLQGLIADTPGFSALAFEEIKKEELTQYFPEMWSRRAECKFSGCLHHKEPKCAVKQAVKEGTILSSRYEHYLLFLNEIEKRKPDYRK